MNIKAPYLLFIGDAKDPLSIKMARSAADWCPEKCVGEYALSGCEVTTGLTSMDIEEAAKQGAKSLVLGFANSGGTFDQAWTPAVIRAMEHGMDIISGLHDKLEDTPEILEKAQSLGRQLINIRHPNSRFRTGTGEPRVGKRLLTVGTDCSVGKMYTGLSLTKHMEQRGMDVSFKATGQCGILVTGAGVAIDCVVSDFISGAVEAISPEVDENHWQIIEGQGSLSHPAFAGVSLGLLHGAQADAIVVCHALGRGHMRGLKHQPLPSIEDTIELNEQLARLTNPDAKVVGVAVNTSAVDAEQAKQYCASLAERLKLPCVDPLRHGVGPIIDNLS